jgi:hypothetical protein
MPSLDSRQIGDIVAGVFTPARQTLEVVGAPPIFHRPNGCTLHACCTDVGARSGPEVGFEEIAIDLLQARFWITSG